MDNYVIMDTSPFVYSAMSRENLKDLKYNNLPIGGLVHILRNLISDCAIYREVMLCLDSKTFRKDIDGDYKKGRMSRPDVYVQLDLLKRFLDELKLPYGKKDGYEADDVVYSYCEYLNYFNKASHIIIKGNDYDLLHNLDDKGKIEFEGITRQVLDVDAFSIKNIYKGDLLINTKTPRNIFLGDGDYNKSFKLENGMTGRDLYNGYKEAVEKSSMDYITSRHEDTVREYVEFCGGTENDMKELDRRIEIFYPKLLTDINFNSINKEMLKTQQFLDMLYALGVDDLNKTYLLFGKKNDINTESIINFLFRPNKGKNRFTAILDEIARDYENGAYMVDNNLSFNDLESGYPSEFLEMF